MDRKKKGRKERKIKGDILVHFDRDAGLDLDGIEAEAEVEVVKSRKSTALQ